MLSGALVLVTVCASAQPIEIEGRYWPATLPARAQVMGGRTDVPSNLSTLDLKDDLGLSNKSNAVSEVIGAGEVVPARAVWANQFARSLRQVGAAVRARADRHVVACTPQGGTVLL